MNNQVASLSTLFGIQLKEKEQTKLVLDGAKKSILETSLLRVQMYQSLQSILHHSLAISEYPCRISFIGCVV